MQAVGVPAAGAVEAGVLAALAVGVGAGLRASAVKQRIRCRGSLHAAITVAERGKRRSPPGESEKNDERMERGMSFVVWRGLEAAGREDVPSFRANRCAEWTDKSASTPFCKSPCPVCYALRFLMAAVVIPLHNNLVYARFPDCLRVLDGGSGPDRTNC